MADLIIPAGFRRIEMPRIASMAGSDNDLVQMILMHEFLLEASSKGMIRICDEWTNSIHRNPIETLSALKKLIGKVDAIIVGAGWANHLTGCANAFLRNWFRNDHIVVFGVAIEDPEDSDHTQAAISSITELPGSEVVYDNYLGEEGCLRAATDASKGIYPIIHLKDYDDLPKRRPMEEAVRIGKEKKLEIQLKKGGSK